jgi:Ca-activated chloride channel family protein
MFRFANPEYFYFLLLIPVFIALRYAVKKHQYKLLQRFGKPELILSLIPDVSNAKTKWKLFFQYLAYCMMIIAIARPQMGSKLEEIKREGTDIMIALDVSNSMLAEDLSPNRLTFAKRAITKFVDKLKGDRIGIVIFAGEAYIQLPITTDYSATKLFINTINTESVGSQGTAIKPAIEICSQVLEKNEKSGKSIILITDGENHEEGSVEAAGEAASKGIKIHTIGIGSPTGVPIPIYNGQVLSGYRKDKEGNTVISRLNEVVLQQISQAANGVYVRANNSFSGLDQILDEIEKLEKSELTTQSYTDYEEQFQFFVGLAIFFLFADYMLSRRKSKFFSKINLFGKS